MLTDAQKEILRDCFEGCMSLNYALGAAGLHHIIPRGHGVALWRRWQTEMDGQGFYTF